MILGMIAGIIVKPNSLYIEDLNRILVTGNPKKINQARKDFINQMFCTYIIFYLYVISLLVFGLLYCTCFCYVYVQSSNGWIFGTTISLVLRIGFMQIAGPILITTFRICAKRCPNNKCVVKSYSLVFIACFKFNVMFKFLRRLGG